MHEKERKNLMRHLTFQNIKTIVHAPKKYWEDIKTLLNEELEAKHLSRCEYGHILWHLNGRKDLNDMLNNGFKMVTNDEGQEVLTAVDCE